MHSDLLDTFLDLMETHNFNRTAERLGLRQSTVSARIMALEQQLGTPLFARSRAGSQPTPAGQTFLPRARALRHEWNEARRALAGDPEQPRLRIGLQSDLATSHIGDWLQGFLHALPSATFYIEADFSAQMSDDVQSGQHDFAVLYTPFPHPDLLYERLGEVTYRMISTHAATLSAIAPDRLMLADYSPAFSAAQRAVLTQPARARVASGLSSTTISLLRTLGGTAYVLDRAAAALIADGTARLVIDAPPILQPVYALTHIRRSHAAIQRRLLAAMRAQFPRKD